MSSLDIIILSNAPGEITTWVRPVVREIYNKFRDSDRKVRISVILSPCPHATGKEAEIALKYPEVDRVLEAKDFFAFLFWGKTANNWDWFDRGIVIFLGGDQFYTLVIGKRLGYHTLVYAEWEARWYRWLDSFAVMKSEVLNNIPNKYHYKFTVVGDLISDVVKEVSDRSLRKDNKIIIGLLPGSKSAKLMQGVPLCLAIAEHLKLLNPNVEFIIPVAPSLDINNLVKYGDRDNNYLVNEFGGVTGELLLGEKNYLVTSGGIKIELITKFPAYQNLLECKLCVTTVGANTAELGSLGIPSIVLIPTQQLDAMRSWDGLPGMLANLPLLGSLFAKLINSWVLRKKRLFAWPNIWAKKEIVPELVGKLDPKDIAQMIHDYLNNPEKLERMKDELIVVRGESGAANKIASIVYRIE